jgi:hypothetical protein
MRRVLTVCLAAAALAGCAEQPAPQPEPSPIPPVVRNEIKVASVVEGKDVYLFRIEDAVARRLEFEQGRTEGEAEVYRHPDQNVLCLHLKGKSTYRQPLSTKGPVTLLFYTLPTGGRARIDWLGDSAEVDLKSEKPGGDWVRVTLSPRG